LESDNGADFDGVGFDGDRDGVSVDESERDDGGDDDAVKECVRVLLLTTAQARPARPSISTKIVARRAVHTMVLLSA
jgi:hypothetical protein